MRPTAALLALLLATPALPPPWLPAARAAGFDCRKAAAPDEKAVCADPLLSRLDTLLGRAYAEAKAAGIDEEITRLARDILADRRACGAERACLLAAYAGGINAYRNDGASVALPEDVTAETIAGGKARMSARLPETIGQCVATTVDGVHPRLETEGPPTDADFDAGTGIDYRNGGYQVSYSPEAALIASKPGDRVVMCLVAVPHHCPPGDDRGRDYMVTNTRTGDTWTMADSQHRCGGA